MVTSDDDDDEYTNDGDNEQNEAYQATQDPLSGTSLFVDTGGSDGNGKVNQQYSLSPTIERGFHHVQNVFNSIARHLNRDTRRTRSVSTASQSIRSPASIPLRQPSEASLPSPTGNTSVTAPLTATPGSVRFNPTVATHSIPAVTSTPQSNRTNASSLSAATLHRSNRRDHSSDESDESSMQMLRMHGFGNGGGSYGGGGGGLFGGGDGGGFNGSGGGGSGGDGGGDGGNQPPPPPGGRTIPQILQEMNKNIPKNTKFPTLEYHDTSDRSRQMSWLAFYKALQSQTMMKAELLHVLSADVPLCVLIWTQPFKQW
jgi:hypothetical protein